MKYIKHPMHGNRHVSDAEADELELAGWVIWPRKPEQKGGMVEFKIPTIKKAEPMPEIKAPVKSKKPNILTGE